MYMHEPTDSLRPQQGPPIAELLHEFDVYESYALAGQDWYTCRDLAGEIANRQHSPEQAVQTVVSIVDGVISGREPNLTDQELPQAATAPHQHGLERKIAELSSLWDEGSDSREWGVLAVLEHKLKRELSAAYADTLYAQGVLTVDPETFVAEYVARCGNASAFQDTDRSNKPDISDVVLNEDNFVVERARMVLSWAQKYPNLLPATWDEWNNPSDVLVETNELDIDLPPELIEPLADHPNDFVRGKLLTSQILTIEQINKAVSLFEEKPYGGGLPKAELNWSAVVKHQYRLRRARLGASTEEARQMVQPIEELLGVPLEIKDNTGDDHKFGRPFNNQLGDKDRFIIQGTGRESTLVLLYESLGDHFEEIDEAAHQIEDTKTTEE